MFCWCGIRETDTGTKETGLKRIRIHDLHYSCATLLYANGVDMKFIQ